MLCVWGNNHVDRSCLVILEACTFYARSPKCPWYAFCLQMYFSSCYQARVSIIIIRVTYLSETREIMYLTKIKVSDYIQVTTITRK